MAARTPILRPCPPVARECCRCASATRQRGARHSNGCPLVDPNVENTIATFASDDARPEPHLCTLRKAVVPPNEGSLDDAGPDSHLRDRERVQRRRGRLPDSDRFLARSGRRRFPCRQRSCQRGRIDTVRFEKRSRIDIQELGVGFDLALIEHAAGEGLQITAFERVEAATARTLTPFASRACLRRSPNAFMSVGIRRA